MTPPPVVEKRRSQPEIGYQIATQQIRFAPALGDRVRQARHEADPTQTILADRIGCEQHVISHYEDGSLRMHADLLPDLARELEKPLSYFWESADTLVIVKGNRLYEIVTWLLASRELLNVVYHFCQMRLFDQALDAPSQIKVAG